MDMTPISMCNVTQCAYNQANLCHTLGINVGSHAECNTYNYRTAKGGDRQIMAGIGACLASECRHNQDLECKAPNIDVTFHDSHADCKTFEAKR